MMPLNDVSGYVMPGKLTALTVESGAGKMGFLPGMAAGLLTWCAGGRLCY